MWIIWTVLAFLSGSIPYSLLLGRVVRGVDIRAYGDANPGAANVLRAAGWGWGLVAMLLDGLKGALPVGLAWFFAGISGWQIVPVALAAPLGHALSPWLGGRGGKAVAVSFGVWAGLTVGAAPTVLGLLLGVMFAVIASSGWALLGAFMLFGIFIGQFYAPVHPELMAVWIGNFLILVWKHQTELRNAPVLRYGAKKT